jgi:sugar O-acyltransferase (sialic acid O-acetyltransferase NeuD family)
MKNFKLKPKIIIFGLNDPAEMAHFYLNQLEFNEKRPLQVAFTVHKKYIKNSEFKGLPVVPWEEIDKYYNPLDYHLFAPIIDNKLREKIYKEGKDKGYSFYSYVSPYCFDFTRDKIGENCFILEQNTLQPFTHIGNNVILWSGNHIGHHSVIEDNCFITSHVVISGHCLIKQGAYLGVNSTIRDGVTIGENCIIGMGSLVTKDTESNKIYMGSPAKIKD